MIVFHILLLVLFGGACIWLPRAYLQMCRFPSMSRSDKVWMGLLVFYGFGGSAVGLIVLLLALLP